MKIFKHFLAVVTGISVIFIALISAFEIGIYADYEFYRKEYRKYEVLSDLDMEMSDVMYVTEEMMEYLRGNREELSVITTVDGVEQDFFNEQDRFHMKEVKKLFLGGVVLRRWAFGIFAASLLLIVLICRTKNPRFGESIPGFICRGYQIALSVFATAITALGIWMAIDFSAVFVKFHEIFFDNDLWLFDPAEDYMINMLPEGLFFDFVVRIGTIFILFLCILLGATLIIEMILRYRLKNK